MGSWGRFVFENATQAEDRFLSHLSVSETGMDSKWVNGADFYYEPHYTWWGLIEQRKRWFNGTTASFIYFMWLEKDTPISSSSRALVQKRYRSQERQCCRKFLWDMQLWASFGALLGPGFTFLALKMSDEYLKETFRTIYTVCVNATNATNKTNGLMNLKSTTNSTNGIMINNSTRCGLTNITWESVVGHADVQYNIVEWVARAFAFTFLAWLLLAFFCSSPKCKKNRAVALIRNMVRNTSIIVAAVVMITLVFANIMYVSQSGSLGQGLTIVMVVFFLPMVLALTRGDPMACVIMTGLNFMGYMWVMVFYFSFVPWYVGETREINPTHHSINEH